MGNPMMAMMNMMNGGGMGNGMGGMGMGGMCGGMGGMGAMGGMGGMGGGKECKVWVGGVPMGVSADELKDNFGAAGTVVDAKMMKKGTAMVQFSSRNEAQMAIEMYNGVQINGSTLQVDVWT